MGKYVKKGYANNKPPVEHQFKPGHSGHRPGRPKGSQSHATMLRDLLNAPIPVLVNGRRTRKMKWRVMVEQQINAAVSGDLKAFQAVMQLKVQYGLIAQATPDDIAPVATRDDEAVIALLRERFKKSNPEGEDD